MAAATVGVAEALESRLRSLSGAFLFAIPIIYTMEVWQLGRSASVGKVLAFLALAYVLDVGLNVTSGFRSGGSLVQYLQDATETLAIGIVVGAAMLVLLGINRLDASPVIFLRQVLMLAMPISIGASLARTLLGEKGHDEAPAPREESPWSADVRDLGVTVAGGVFLATAIVPHIREEALNRTPGRLVVPFEVTNQGHASVDEVTIEIRLRGSRDQVREQRIAHLPLGATFRGTVVFYDPLQNAQPEARVLGFQTP